MSDSQPGSLKVYWGSGSQPAWRVLLALEVKQVPYESRLLSFGRGEHRTPEFLRMNPRHQVPVIEHDGYCLYESMAILAYLDRAFPEPSLFGATAQETGLIWRWVFEFQNHLDEPLQDRIVRPIFFNKTDEHGAALREAIPKLHTELARWEAALGASNWLVGERLSAADIVLFPSLMGLLRAAGKPNAAEFDLGLLPFNESYPKLGAWVSRIEALPGYDKTYPPHWREG